MGCSKTHKECHERSVSAVIQIKAWQQWPRYNARQIEHADTVEWACHDVLAADPKGLGFVGSGKHNPTTDGDRFAA